MSLNFKLSNIENWQELLNSDGTVSPKTEAVIFLTMFVGIGDITPKTAEEFACRTHLFEIIGGPVLIGPDGPIYTTLADIQRHIGLHTNAAPLTRAQFINTYVWPSLQKKVAGKS